MEKANAFQLIRQFWSGKKRYFFIAMLGSALNIMFMFLAPQIIRITIDGVIGGDTSVIPQALQFLLGQEAIVALLLSALLILVSILLAGLAGYITRVNIAKASEALIKQLRDKLFAHVQKLPFRWHVGTKTGDIIQRCTSDVEVLHNFLSAQVVEVSRTFVLIVIALVLMFSMHVPLALFAAAFIPIVVGYSAFFYGRLARKFHKTDIAEGELMVRVQENLTGVRVVKAFGRQQWELEKFREKNNAFAKAWIDLGYLYGLYWGLGDIVTGVQTMGVVVLGTYFAVTGQITLGILVAFVSYSQILTWPVRALGRTLSEMSQTGVAAKRLLDILDAQPEEEPENAKTTDLKGDIIFRDVSFAYHDAKEQPVLKNLNFTIPQGTVFGVLGATGSGKSTISYLLTRLHDVDEGSIFINGVNIQEINRKHLRQQVGLVLQEPFLFSKTIGENIGIAKDGATIEEIRAAAKIANVDEDILGFAKGYDTTVGERGVTLSGGQKQRVAIARTLLQKAPIFIFDDSLSAVDMETDEKIQKALRDKTAGATVILISHRVMTLMHADQILVLEDGVQKELGNHQNLLEQGGIYSRVYALQSALGKEENHGTV